MRHFLFCCYVLLICPAISFGQNVGIGTTSPETRLHVVDLVSDVHLKVESPALGSEAKLSLLAGNNPFSSLFISKYAPGSLGTFAGLSKDNLSVISTGGNAGILLFNTGDGISPLVFGAGTGERMRITAEGRVGIGTTTPATANRLHVHNSDFTTGSDVSIGITNNITTDAPLRGARFRMLNSDLIVHNYEASGKIQFSTAFNTRMTIDNAGNVGIGTLSPIAPLEVITTGNTYGIRVENSNNISQGVSSSVSGTTEAVALSGGSSNNSSGANLSVGVHGSSGTGGTFITQPSNYGVKGESLNTSRGIGVFGGSNSGSANLLEAAIFGLNWSNNSNAYGIIGKSNGSSGAGTVGFTSNATAGLLGYATLASTGPAIKSTTLAGSSQIGLELENGFIKVSGASRTVFQHTATAGNTAANETIIPNTTFANAATDMLIITPVWNGVYVNAPIGVYFAGGTWRIFRQDLAAMPVGAIFNVLVVKQ